MAIRSNRPPGGGPKPPTTTPKPGGAPAGKTAKTQATTSVPLAKTTRNRLDTSPAVVFYGSPTSAIC